MSAYRASVAASAIAVLVGACATGIAPADDSLDQNENAAPPPATDPPSGSNDDPADTGPPSKPKQASSDGGGSPDAGSAPDAAPDTGPVTCTKTLTIPSISLSDSVCGDINTKVTKSPATLTYPCAGGNASATFGAQAFTGTVTGGKLSITNVEKFTLKNCQLESTQTITGDLTAAPLAYAYSEKFVGGDCSGFIHCGANGKVNVQ